MRVEPEIFEKWLFMNDCKASYTLTNSSNQNDHMHVKRESVTCKEAVEHLERIYINSIYAFNNTTARDISIQKYNRHLPFLKKTWTYKNNKDISLNELYYAIKEKNEN